MSDPATDYRAIEEECRRDLHRVQLGLQEWLIASVILDYSFAVGAAGIGLLPTPLEPVSQAAAFLSVGGWAIDHIPELWALGPGPAAMCVAAQRHFGWNG